MSIAGLRNESFHFLLMQILMNGALNKAEYLQSLQWYNSASLFELWCILKKKCWAVCELRSNAQYRNIFKYIFKQQNQRPVILGR